MSNLGISIAGSVAQGSLQAQQVSRALHRQQTDTAAEARRVRERLDAHLAALDEGDEVNLLSQLHVDEQVPEHEHSPDSSGNQQDAKPGAEEEEATAQADDESASPPCDAGHHHLDVTA